MKAVSSQIPVNEGQISSQKHGSEQGLDKVWAMMRRISARLTEVENAVSILKRDVNRIDRKQYRDEAKPPSEIPQSNDFDAIINQMLRGG